MPRFLILIFFLLSFLPFACSERAVDPDGNSPATLDVSPLLSFDDSRYYKLFALHVANDYELYVDGDRVIGEPFIDINGNGVYDRGIDIFYMSPDPDVNMDLNHNGSYDGPYSTWEPGIPFDDYNRNDQYDRPNTVYDTSEAFCDLNGNGRFDSFLRDTLVFIVQPRVDTTSPLGRLQEFAILDSIWHFISDSGYVVRLPARSRRSWDAVRNRRLAFLVSSFVSNGRIDFLAQTLFSDTLVLPLFDSLTIPVMTSRISADWLNVPYEPFEFNRSYQLGDTLTIDGYQYDNLVRVTFDSLSCADSVRESSFENAELTFWIDLNRGPLAIQSNQLLSSARKVLIVPLSDTLPLPMTR